MERYKAILAYDGTGFKGFQRQSEARTVQAEVEKALARVGWRGRSLLAAGRTDSGVHAAGQVIAFDLAWRHPVEALRGALNALLPPDVALQSVAAAAPDFHPRFDALSRRYVYRLVCAQTRDPLRARFSWHVWPAPKLAVLQEIAGHFIGERDFAGYGGPMQPGESTVRRVIHSEWTASGDELHYVVEANAFLFRMVRRIVKAQVEVAAGRKPANTIEHFLTGKSAGMYQGLAPPQGLNLAAVRYPEYRNTEFGD